MWILPYARMEMRQWGYRAGERLEGRFGGLPLGRRNGFEGLVGHTRDLEGPYCLQNVADAQDFRAQGFDAPFLGFMRDVGFDAAERTRHLRKLRFLA